MFASMVGRIPVIDVSPVVAGGRYPAKAAVGEPFTVAATIFREGHDALNADVVLTGPDGKRRPWVRMRKLPDPVDRWAAKVVPDLPGPWTFEIEAWSDPYATWQHNAEIKVPAGIDVELMFTEGALLLEQVAAQLPKKDPARAVVADALSGIRDTKRPDQVRLAAALTPAVLDVVHDHPVRELVTTEGPFRFTADRERALYGSWYEFFPRSEGAYVDEKTGKVVSGTFRTAADVLVGEQRHRRDLAVTVAVRAVLVEDRGDVLRKRRDLVGRRGGACCRDRQDDDEGRRGDRQRGPDTHHLTSEPAGFGGVTGLNSIPVYCISSQVWSPHFTSIFASGLFLFPGELSYQAVETIFAPFGTWRGSVNM
jgi:hypothetical protein